MNSHSHLTQKKTHTHTHSHLTPVLENKTPPWNCGGLFFFWIWWRQLWYCNASGSLANLSARFFVDNSKPISLYPKKSTIHQRRSRRLKYKRKQNGFFSSCSVYLWSPLTQWIRVGIMILKPLYCKSKIQSLILGVHIPFIEANERWFDLNKNTHFARWISSNIEASHVKCQPSFLIKRTCTHMLFVSSCSTIYFPQHPFM